MIIFPFSPVNGYFDDCERKTYYSDITNSICFFESCALVVISMGVLMNANVTIYSLIESCLYIPLTWLLVVKFKMLFAGFQFKNDMW